jgi:hypothetical protein
VSSTGVESIQPVSIVEGTRFVPPLEGYDVRSESSWETIEPTQKIVAIATPSA